MLQQRRQVMRPHSPLLALVAALSAAALLVWPVAAQPLDCVGNPRPVANTYWNCNGTAEGADCIGRCKTGYTTQPPPRARCQAGTWMTPTGGCFRVCSGGPDPAILKDGTWPANCTDATRWSTYCHGQCNPGFRGRPRILCMPGWRGFDTTTVIGKCTNATGGVCPGLPNTMLVDGRFPRSCADTPAGQVCTAVCNPGRGGAVAPTVACIQDSSVPVWGARWADTADGACGKVCTGLPEASLGGKGHWPASCNGKTPFNRDCTAVCNKTAGYYGNPTVRCGANGWEDVVVGACREGAVCSGLPDATTVNGRWPMRCLDTLVNDSCTAVCNRGYGSATLPTIKCLLVNGSPQWAETSLVGECRKVCMGLPPHNLGAAGYWPERCNSRLNMLGKCTAVCNTTAGYYGAPMAMCGANGWASNVIGACRDRPVCSGLPPVNIINGIWPTTCVDTAVNGSCVAHCNSRYGGLVLPTLKCVMVDGTPTWDVLGLQGACEKVCPGLPMDGLLGVGASWPSSCADRVNTGRHCRGKCGLGLTGTATVPCLGDGWADYLSTPCELAPESPPSPSPLPGNISASPSPTPGNETVNMTSPSPAPGNGTVNQTSPSPGNGTVNATYPSPAPGNGTVNTTSPSPAPGNGTLNQTSPAAGNGTLNMTSPSPAPGNGTVNQTSPSAGNGTVNMTLPSPAPGNGTVNQTLPSPTPGNETVNMTYPSPAPDNGTVNTTLPSPAPGNGTWTVNQTSPSPAPVNVTTPVNASSPSPAPVNQTLPSPAPGNGSTTGVDTSAIGS